MTNRFKLVSLQFSQVPSDSSFGRWFVNDIDEWLSFVQYCHEFHGPRILGVVYCRMYCIAINPTEASREFARLIAKDRWSFDITREQLEPVCCMILTELSFS